jgi:hypothetical protein
VESIKTFSKLRETSYRKQSPAPWTCPLITPLVTTWRHKPALATGKYMIIHEIKKKTPQKQLKLNHFVSSGQTKTNMIITWSYLS